MGLVKKANKVNREIVLVYMLVVLHFTNNSSSFCYSYIAAEVPFQLIKKTLIS